MRINRFVATATGMSRREADIAIQAGRIMVNGEPATLGSVVTDDQSVTLDNTTLTLPKPQTIMLNKPIGYVSSRAQQGSAPTIYDLLPHQLHTLKPVGRLDKDSSGLLLLTNDGQLAHRLAHPSNHKWKIYEITTKPELQPKQIGALRQGIMLDDGISIMDVSAHSKGYTVRLQEGRNRQIRRSIEAVGSKVATLHRTKLGELELGALPNGDWRKLTTEELPS